MDSKARSPSDEANMYQATWLGLGVGVGLGQGAHHSKWSP